MRPNPRAVTCGPFLPNCRVGSLEPVPLTLLAMSLTFSIIVTVYNVLVVGPECGLRFLQWF